MKPEFTVTESCKATIHSALFISAAFLFLGISFNVKAQSVRVASSKKQVIIGEPFRVSWTVSSAEITKLTVNRPDWGNVELLGWADTNIVDAQGIALFRRTFRLMFLEPGNHVLSGQTIIVRKGDSIQKVRVPALSVNCVLMTVMQPETAIGPPLAIGYARAEWLPYAAGAGGLFLTAIGWVAYRRRNRFSGWKNRLANHPYALAVSELKALRKNSLPAGQADIFQKDKTSYGRLSGIVKGFLAGKFQIAAHQLTDDETSEILAEKGVLQNNIIELKIILSEIKSSRFSENGFSIEKFQSLQGKTENLLKEMNT